MCNSISLLSPLISVKQLVEEQCFCKPSSVFGKSVDVSIEQLWFIALTTNTCAFEQAPDLRSSSPIVTLKKEA